MQNCHRTVSGFPFVKSLFISIILSSLLFFSSFYLNFMSSIYSRNALHICLTGIILPVKQFAKYMFYYIAISN